MTGRVLVTGVTGFVGSHLARELLASGAEVHAIVRPGAHLERIPDLVDRVTVHVDDGESGSLRAIVDAVRPASTFHLATNFVAEHTPDDVAPLVRDNVTFPSRLLDALAVHGGTFVNVGTCWQHVNGARYRPKNLYAATKQAFEDVLAFYDAQGGVRAITVNLYDTYGPLDHRAKVLRALLEALRTGDALAMSSGTQLVDLVHVADVGRALHLAAGLRTDGGGSGAPDPPYYALSSGCPRTLRELVEVLGAVAGRPVPVVWGARRDRPGDMVEHWDAGPPLPGWTPTIGLEAGLAALLAG